MENCLKTQLKGTVNNDNLEILGYAKVYINTIGLSANTNIYFLNTKTGTTVNKVIGSYLLGGKTFANGKTIIEEGDSMQFAPNNTYELMVPKYNCIPYPSGMVAEGNSSIISFNLDDYKVLDNPTVQLSTDWVTSIYVYPTQDNKYMTGDLNDILEWMNPDTFNYIRTNSSTTSFVKLNIETDIIQFKNLRRCEFRNNTNMYGNLRTFLTNYCSRNKTYLKERTTNLVMMFYNTSIELDVFDIVGASSITLTFNGTSLIDITISNINGTTLKSYSYDIDTDTLTEQ